MHWVVCVCVSVAESEIIYSPHAFLVWRCELILRWHLLSAVVVAWKALLLHVWSILVALSCLAHGCTVVFSACPLPLATIAVPCLVIFWRA